MLPQRGRCVNKANGGEKQNGGRAFKRSSVVRAEGAVETSACIAWIMRPRVSGSSRTGEFGSSRGSRRRIALEEELLRTGGVALQRGRRIGPRAQRILFEHGAGAVRHACLRAIGTAIRDDGEGTSRRDSQNGGLAAAVESFSWVGGADEDRTHDLLNAIQALSQTELRPHEAGKLTSAGRGNSSPAGGRGAFYGTALRCRNEKSEGRQAAFGERSVLPLPLAAEAQAAGLGTADRRRGPAQAEGGEATGRRLC